MENKNQKEIRGSCLEEVERVVDEILSGKVQGLVIAMQFYPDDNGTMGSSAVANMYSDEIPANAIFEGMQSVGRFLCARLASRDAKKMSGEEMDDETAS